MTVNFKSLFKVTPVIKFSWSREVVVNRQTNR